MYGITRKILTAMSIFMLIIPIYAKAENESPDSTTTPLKDNISTTQYISDNFLPESAKREEDNRLFLNWINSNAYAATIDKDEEKRILREKWRKMLGLDIFYPYFKAKQVEHWIKQKASIKVHKIHGKPQFNDNQIKYIFKIKF